jgi:predicted ATP-dependent endonuclease of OLD family
VKLISIGLTNFRSFRNAVVFANLKKVNVFVGPNKARKSNVFEALSLFKSLASHQQSTRTPLNYHFDRRTKNPIVLNIELELSDRERNQIVNWMPRHRGLFKKGLSKDRKIFKYVRYHGEMRPNINRAVGPGDITDEELFVSDDSGHYTKIIHHMIRHGVAIKYSADLDVALSRLQSIDNFCKVKLSNRGTRSVFRGILAGNETEIEYRIGEMIKDFLKKIRIFPSSRRAESIGEVEEGSRISEDGHNLVSAIHALNEHRTKELRKELKRIVGIKNITTPAVGPRITVSVSEEGLASRMDLENMSFGLQQILILRVVLITAEPDQTICIEEPEMNIHSSAQKMVFDLIRSRKGYKNQFFLTTHSSIFTAVAEDVNTFLINRTKVGSTSLPIEDRSDLSLIKQQLGIRNSDIYGSD